MRNRFDQQLALLNVELVTMGALCEEALTYAIRALFQKEEGMIDRTLEADAQIDQKEKDIEQTEAQIKATEQSTKVQKSIASQSPTFPAGEKTKETKEEKSTKGKSPAEEQREKAESDKEEKGYSRLEQKQHEKTRVGETKRSEKLAKFRNKSV